MNGHCARQRVNLTDEQISKHAAPCPKCGKVIGLVVNRSLKQATMSPHKSAVKVEVKPDPPAKLNVAPVPDKQLSF